MLKILYELRTKQKTACIYANYSDSSKFLFGEVIAINENEIAIHLISPDGDDDGIVVISVDSVIRVEIDSKYVEKMKKLYSKKDSLYEFNINDDDIFNGVLSIAFKEEYIVSIELLDSGYDNVVGIIREMDEGKCKVEQFDEYGCMDGVSYFCKKDISKIAMLTQDEKRIMRLRCKTGDGSVS